jgi:hypothetical protein
MKAAIAVCDTDLVKAIVADNRSPPRPAAPPSNVSIMGAGKVQEFDVGPKYRPYVPPKEDDKATAERPGWREPTPLRPPEGLRYVDAMCHEEDRRFRAQRVKELAEAAAVQRALKAAEPKAQEPKARGDKKA